MTRFPLEASEIHRFTPPSLADTPTPPVFLLKPGTRRDLRLHQRLVIEAGLRRHSDADIRDEMLKGLQQLWSPELLAEHEPKLRAFWDAVDAFAKSLEGMSPEQRVEAKFEHPDKAAADELIERIYASWSPLRRMAADNTAFAQETPALYISCLLVGWENVGISFALDGGVVTLEKLEELAEWLAEIETAQQGKIETVGVPGSAFDQLCLEAGGMLYLPKEEAKNSGSPSPIDSTPSTSNGEATVSSSKGSRTKAASAT